MYVHTGVYMFMYMYNICIAVVVVVVVVVAAAGQLHHHDPTLPSLQTAMHVFADFLRTVQSSPCWPCCVATNVNSEKVGAGDAHRPLCAATAPRPHPTRSLQWCPSPREHYRT